jgi:AcrR family transcriptional regulator
MLKQPPEPRKLPTQNRSKLLVDAIIEACQQILECEGSDQLTTNRIAEVAGVNIGSLYQYFPNKEAILTKIFTEKSARETDRMARESTERVAAKVDISLQATLRELIAVLAEIQIQYLSIHGDFYREYHSFFDFAGQINACVSHDYQQPSLEQWLPQLLSLYQAQITTDNLEQAAFATSKIINGLLVGALEDHPDWLSDESYLRVIEQAVLNFLTGVTPARN